MVMKITSNVIYNICNNNSNINNNTNIINIKKINIKKQLASILESVEDSFEIRDLLHLERKDGYLRVNHHIYLHNRSLFDSQ